MCECFTKNPYKPQVRLITCVLQVDLQIKIIMHGQFSEHNINNNTPIKTFFLIYCHFQSLLKSFSLVIFYDLYTLNCVTHELLGLLIGWQQTNYYSSHKSESLCCGHYNMLALRAVVDCFASSSGFRHVFIFNVWQQRPALLCRETRQQQRCTNCDSKLRQTVS